MKPTRESFRISVVLKDTEAETHVEICRMFVCELEVGAHDRLTEVMVWSTGPSHGRPFGPPVRHNDRMKPIL